MFGYRSDVALAIVFAGLIIGPHLTLAAVIQEPDSGAPTDGKDRTLFIGEGTDELIASLSYQALADPKPIVVMPNAQGMFVLPFLLVSGSLNCCALPDDANSDTIVFTGHPTDTTTGTTIVNIFSEAPSMEVNPFPDPGETESVTANDHKDVPHTTTIKITSPPEPATVPEPGSIALLGAGMMGLAAMRRWRSRRGHTAER